MEPSSVAWETCINTLISLFAVLAVRGLTPCFLSIVCHVHFATQTKRNGKDCWWKSVAGEAIKPYCHMRSRYNCSLPTCLSRREFDVALVEPSLGGRQPWSVQLKYLVWKR